MYDDYEIDQQVEYAEEIHFMEDVNPPEPKWCTDCKEVVLARNFYDRDTGYTEWICPNSGDHFVEEIEYCECGEPMGESDEVCPACMDELRSIRRRVLEILPNGLSLSTAFEVIEYMK